MMSLSIVIPAYNRYDLLHQLLFDLYKNCSLIEEVIVVNNGSTEAGMSDGLNWWKDQKMLPLTVITKSENIGFTLASNLGLKEAVEDVVCLISTDVRVHTDIVPHLNTHTDFLIGGRLLDWDTGWNTFNGITYSYLEGWFLSMSKANWEKCEYFDPAYSPYDMEDIDLSATAKTNGIPLSVLPDGWVSHIGAQSIGYNPEREAITLRNKEYFRKKWTKQ